MKGKKGFELTATFLVILIITIVIFVGSIYFTKKFFSTAEEMRATIDRQTEAEIESLLFQEGSIVAMPMFKKAIVRGKQGAFWLGIRNILEKTENFYVLVKFSKAFSPDEEVIPTTDSDYINTKWLLYNPGPYTIENNAFEMVPVLANVDLSMADGVTTQQGTYSFNVCVISGTIPSGFDCASPPKPIPPSVYSGKIYKMYVEVS
ncbi:hypothetical protein JW707_01485 [Candidatus Woesearchaeota archaeon]|nr:hypothetical protein [Candidatus Woesearchaeota archaeon]